ncbi:hypothetical protein FHG87_011641 [Trinorchestia longiramus]|nr:hypothetical protein FHG87_011641 [Trinorchestia longiramus]
MNDNLHLENFKLHRDSRSLTTIWGVRLVAFPQPEQQTVLMHSVAEHREGHSWHARWSKNSCSAKTTAVQQQLQCKNSCSARAAAVQEKMQSENNCSAKTTADQKHVQCKNKCNVKTTAGRDEETACAPAPPPSPALPPAPPPPPALPPAPPAPPPPAPPAGAAEEEPLPVVAELVLVSCTEQRQHSGLGATNAPSMPSPLPPRCCRCLEDLVTHWCLEDLVTHRCLEDLVTHTGALKTWSHTGALKTWSYTGALKTWSYTGALKTWSYTGALKTWSYTGNTETWLCTEPAHVGMTRGEHSEKAQKRKMKDVVQMNPANKEQHNIFQKVCLVEQVCQRQSVLSVWREKQLLVRACTVVVVMVVMVVVVMVVVNTECLVAAATAARDRLTPTTCSVQGGGITAVVVREWW